MTEIITTKLYDGEVTIDFYPNSHRYKANGEWVKNSVTKISGIVDKSTPLMWWACKCMRDELLEDYQAGRISDKTIVGAVSAFQRIKKKATDIGTIVHDFCEAYALNRLEGTEKPELPEDEKALAGVLAFLKWVKESRIEFLAVEQMVYSRKYNYVGKFDLLAKINGKNGKLVLIDYKTSKAFYPVDMGMQTSGYQIAYEEESGKKIDQRLILRFDKETGEFETHILKNHAQDKAAFLAAKHLKEYQEELTKKKIKITPTKPIRPGKKPWDD